MTVSTGRYAAPHIVLLGATGYTGGAFLRRLAETGTPWRVTALVRTPPRHRLPFVTYVLGALPDALPAGFPPPDATVLVHLATEHHGDVSRLRTVNVDGTREVLSRLPPSVRGVVHGSSMSVYGQGAQEGVAETAGTAPGTALAHTRLAAERVVLEEMRRRDGTAYVLRPRFLPGADDRSFLPMAARLRTLPLRLDPDQVRLGLMDVDDYAEVVVRLVERAHERHLRRAPVQRALNVAYREPVTLRQLFDIAAPPGAGTPVRLVPPETLIRWARRMPGRRGAQLTTLLELATRSHWPDVRALEAEIGSDITDKSPMRVLRARRSGADDEVTTHD
ncbi:NAD-dependent epimerase/dehydratase family protein [Streptomyces venetus]|uniref:NAD-dependent epimerase/dehydratase family protein n=1 Tax=Streptomyces venetus TaxID=1701086 RepID=UPI003C2BC72A